MIASVKASNESKQDRFPQGFAAHVTIGSRTWTRWLPPPTGHWKFNVDASCCKDTKTAGGGGILRNPAGEVFAVFYEYSGAVTNVAEAEMRAVESSLEALQKLHL